MAPVRTTCAYCGVGCGILATAHADGTVEIKGDPDHPSNHGRLCSKGTALAETLSLDDRLLHPIVDGARTDWDSALDLTAKRFRDTIAEHGPDSVAFYVSGQLLTEDYYLANKLMKGFIGSGNIDTNSRLCMASSVAGHKRAFGADTVPGCYEDLSEADLIVLVGSNLAWCHPVLYQRVITAREARGTKVVVIDPRRTATAEGADLHLPIAPGTDVALFDGLLAHLHGDGAIDEAFVADHTTGMEAALGAARAVDLAEVADLTMISEHMLALFYKLFADTERVVTVYSQGVNQSTSGTDKVNAIINCHLLTGRIGRPGMGPSSITGQPNAMGGREVGGLANQLACHMEIDNPSHQAVVADFWGAPDIAKAGGLKAVDLFEAVGDGRIKALWIMATNPVDSLPEADKVRAALQACPFTVVSDVIRHTDTTAHADVLLPATAWGEKSGTVTNSERRVSRQRAFLPAPGETKPDWWIIAEVARRMGFATAFAYDHMSEIYAEYAGLSGHGNDGTRDFDISAHASISRDEYDGLRPFQWPLPAGATSGEARFFGDGRFFTPDRRARFVPTPPRPPASATCEDFPLILNTGRIRDQWHTMTRTGKAARLMRHYAEPFVEIDMIDAARHGLSDGMLANVRSARGAVTLRVVVSQSQMTGSIFAPMHWTDQFASSARIDALVAANADPISGQPELKYTPVTVAPFVAAWHGVAITAAKPDAKSSDYWALAPAGSGWRLELAGLRRPGNWSELAACLLGRDGETLDYQDTSSGQFRFASFQGDKLLGALYIDREPVTVSRGWAADQLDFVWSDPKQRPELLAGRPAGPSEDPGPIVCVCFGIGENLIAHAIASETCATVDAVGAATSAGTNCGSCRVEIQGILDDANPTSVLAAR
jgi:assimilatory nitrate reductase catalytic subunit